MKSVSSNPRRFTVHISVDEGQLRHAREELDSSLSLKEMIETEFSWLHESGIYLDEVHLNRSRCTR